MPAASPKLTEAVALRLRALGQHIRAHRKRLHVSATTAAQAAGMSRVTLHRIECGEPSVTVGAYLSALAALGLDCQIGAPDEAPAAAPRGPASEGLAVPAQIRLADYPQLQRVAWQVHGLTELTPAEARGLYERNWRHLDPAAMPPHERALVAALRGAPEDSLKPRV